MDYVCSLWPVYLLGSLVVSDLLFFFSDDIPQLINNFSLNYFNRYFPIFKYLLILYSHTAQTESHIEQLDSNSAWMHSLTIILSIMASLQNSLWKYLWISLFGLHPSKPEPSGGTDFRFEMDYLIYRLGFVELLCLRIILKCFWNIPMSWES